MDAIGAKRYESQSGGEREIQRTMLELLNQMDGFDARGDVKARRPACFGARHSFCARPVLALKSFRHFLAPVYGTLQLFRRNGLAFTFGTPHCGREGSAVTASLPGLANCMRLPCIRSWQYPAARAAP